MLFRLNKPAFITIFDRFSLVFNQMVIRCPSEAADGGDRVEIWGERLLMVATGDDSGARGLLIASFPSFWEGQERGSRGLFGALKTVCGLIVSR